MRRIEMLRKRSTNLALFCATTAICVAGFLTNPAQVMGEDWLQFRGNQGTGVALNANPPTEWSKESYAWKVELPGRAIGGVIVVGDQVITTSSENDEQDRLRVYSLDAKTGEIQWTRSLWATGRTICHPLSSMSAPTPASDGKSIYALFASNDLVSLDLQGNVQWMRPLGLENAYAFDDRGLASSPIVVDGCVIVQIECQGDSFVQGINAETGETKWHLPLAKSTCWSSPAQAKINDLDKVIVQSFDRVMMLDPQRGDIEWEVEMSSNQIPSPTVDGQRLYVGSGGMAAYDLGSVGTEPELAWKEQRLGPQRASAVVADGRVLVMRNGILACGDTATGKESWRLRVEGSAFWATPVLAGDHLYAVNDAGKAFVIDVTAENGETVFEHDFEEEMLGSPAVAGDAIYFRGVGTVYCVRNDE